MTRILEPLESQTLPGKESPFSTDVLLFVSASPDKPALATENSRKNIKLNYKSLEKKQSLKLYWIFSC